MADEAGHPASAMRAVSDAFTKVAEQARRWAAGRTPATEIEDAGWTTTSGYTFFGKSLTAKIGGDGMREFATRLFS